MVDRARMRGEARAVLAQLDFDPDPDRPVASLGFAERQLVAIAKALRRRCRIFVLDEPTAALEKREIERLFSVLARMKGQGTAIIYISHRLDEVVAIADRCTVLRDGRVAAVSARGAFAVHDLVAAMTGRADRRGRHRPGRGRRGAARPAGRHSTVRLRAREVIGLAGLLGSGTEAHACAACSASPSRRRSRSATARAGCGIPADAIAAGIGMVPGERALGLVMNQSVRDNILLPNLAALSRLGVLDRRPATASSPS